MERSENIAEISKAMVQFQANVENVKKGSANPFFKSKYADLGDILAAIRKPLSDAKLAIVQGPEQFEGEAVITTMLVHESGEWFRSKIKIRPKDAGPQALGSVITYARRYALSAMLCIATDEDDDAEKAEGRAGGKQKAQPKKATQSGKAAPAAAKQEKKKDPPEKAAPAEPAKPAFSPTKPVWDDSAERYKCANCANYCVTKFSDRYGGHFSYCDCGYKYAWEEDEPKHPEKEKEGADDGGSESEAAS